MGSIETDVREYLKWMEIHNYAKTTIKCRSRYLGYFVDFAGAHGVERSEHVTLELLVSCQQSLFAHRKRDGAPLSFGTQAQRLVPVTHMFSWLRRQHRIEMNPAADMLMPRPDRRLPEATLSAQEMAILLRAPDVSKPLAAARSRRAGGLLLLWTSSRRAHLTLAEGRRLRERDRLRALRKGAKDRYVPIGEGRCSGCACMSRSSGLGL